MIHRHLVLVGTRRRNAGKILWRWLAHPRRGGTLQRMPETVSIRAGLVFDCHQTGLLRRALLNTKSLLMVAIMIQGLTVGWHSILVEVGHKSRKIEIPVIREHVIHKAEEAKTLLEKVGKRNEKRCQKSF